MGAARRRGSAERAAHAPGHVRWASEAGVDASGIGALRTEAEPALRVPKGLEFPNRNHRALGISVILLSTLIGIPKGAETLRTAVLRA